MKKLIFTLVGVCALGLSSFASTTTGDQNPNYNLLSAKYPYEIVVMKPIQMSGNTHGFQFLVRETGCGTDTYVNNRIQQLRNQYAAPGVIVMNKLLGTDGIPRTPCPRDIPYPGDFEKVIEDPIIITPPNKQF
ncbi:hypothetical protein [Myroides guanonis]|uniref:Uncharacterized protein n=1 Tax=Myroides guanonis TaxID=1150112 RepID=A0A1I3PDZ6_9FLAO|nr:hypothetical protein [Myroides guanonis]SFJ19768.1 hypothetical protein SAMN04487893_10488 [Myroides guanonis]